MEAQSTGSNQVVFDLPIDFDAGDWHSITITYCDTNCAVYLEGVQATNTAPINNFPSSSDCANYGLFVGSLSTAGDGQFHGQLQWLATYDHALSAEAVADDYSNVAAYITYWGGSLPSSGGLGYDYGAPILPGVTNGGGTNSYNPAGGYYLPTYTVTTNYADYTNFWLAITNNSTNAFVSIESTLNNLTYEILTNSSLAATNSWRIWQTLTATNSVTPAPPLALGSNALFFKGALVWSSCTNSSTLPDWMSMLYFNSPCIIWPTENGDVERGCSTNGPVLLGYWSFANAGGSPWLGNYGQQPLTDYGLQNPASPWGNALQVDTNASANLSYRCMESNGLANIYCINGAVSLWFKPDWNGGVGPRNSGQLLELGDASSTNGWWSLGVDFTGSVLSFQSESNGVLTTYFTQSITNWSAGNWYQLILNYSPDQTSLYINGQLAQTGPGMANYPTIAERMEYGFSLGSDHTGQNQIRGTIAEVYTFACPLTDQEVATGFVGASTGYGGYPVPNAAFVAAPATGKKAAYSPDGVNWTASPGGLPSSGDWIALAYGNGTFVAIDYGGSNAAYSTDGINWNASTMPVSDYWYSVAYGNGVFVAIPCGNSGETNAAYSSNGINWTASPRGLPYSDSWQCVAYGNGKFVTISFFDNHAAYSTNGINWTASTMPSSPGWQDVAYGNGMFVAIAFQGTNAAFSTNGINWTSSSLPVFDEVWGVVAYGNGKFVAIAGDDHAAYSTNGINWTAFTMPASGWDWMTYGNGEFVAITATNSAYYSANGTNWTASPGGLPPTSDWWVSVAAGYPISSESGTPLFIVTQPVNQTIGPGSNVTFNVTAAGQLPLTYQWRENGQNLTNGGSIAGVQSATLTISGITVSNAGNYSVIVSNSTGTVTSSNAGLAVINIDITSPTNNAIFYASDIDVLGTVTGSAQIQSVTVNGTTAYTNAAYTNESAFFALAISLAVGTNQIAVVAQDVNGNQLEKTLTVTASNSQTNPLVLIPSVSNGYAPLTVNFTVSAWLPGTVESVAWDWQGDGTTSLTTSNLSAQSYTYGVGTYYPVVTVTTSAGTFSSSGGVNGVDANMLDTNVVTIVAEILATNVWSQSVEAPLAVKANADGSVYVLSANPPTFSLYGSNGTILRTLGLSAIGQGFDVDTNGSVYIAMTTNNQVMKWNTNGGSGFTLDSNFNNMGYIGSTNMSAGTNSYQFDGPEDVAVSPDGTAIYVADTYNARIQKFTTAGTFELSIGGFNEPAGVSADVAGGRLFVSDPGMGAVLSLVNDGVVSGLTLSGAARASGDSMALYVTDDESVQQFDSYSYDYICSVPASVGLNQPLDVSIWPSQTEKRVYIADYGNNRVIGVSFPRADPMVPWNAMIQAVANTNLNLALSYFSVWTSGKYGAEFQVVGLTNVATTLSQLPAPTLDEMTDDFADYTVTVTLYGLPTTFYINFANENGIWKISSF